MLRRNKTLLDSYGQYIVFGVLFKWFLEKREKSYNLFQMISLFDFFTKRNAFQSVPNDFTF